jgi:hypothetical protein
MYFRTYSVLGPSRPAFRSLSPPSLPHFSFGRTSTPETPYPSFPSLNPKYLNPHPPPPTTRTPLPAVLHRAHSPPATQIPKFPILSPTHPKPNFSKKTPKFFYFLFNQRAQIHSWIVPLDSVVVFFVNCRGLGLISKGFLNPLFLGRTPSVR